jgi:hypothetical protein
MQTGQNSIAPEISLPQLGQLSWGSVLMDLNVLGPQLSGKQPHAPPIVAKSASSAPWQSVVSFHKQLRSHLS